MPLSRRVSRASPTQPALVAAFIITSLSPVFSQEAVIFSLAGETAAHARKLNAIASQHSNLQSGPFAIGVSAGMELQANDNIFLAPIHAEHDLILRPYLGSRVAWLASERNVLQLAVDAGYSRYLAHDELSRFFIQPGSELSFDLYAGDVWINFHDRLSISQNVYADPTVTGSGNYSQLQSTAGLSGTWDLEKVEINVGYDHSNYIGLSGEGDLPSGRSEVLALNTSVAPGLPMKVGAQLGTGLIHYATTQTARDSVNLSAGAFVRAQPTQYVTVEAAAGYTVYTDHGVAGAESITFNAFYGRLALHHRLNRYVEYDLSGGRSVSFGFYAGTVDLYSLALEARVHCFQKLAISAGLVFEHGSELFAGRGTFDRFGPRLTLEHSIGRNLSAALRYQYLKRQSDRFGDNYEVNILEASLVYRL